MAIELDYDKAVTLLGRAIEEKGADYVYPGATSGMCNYFDGPLRDRPGCIVGHVLHYMGLRPGDVDEVGLDPSSTGGEANSLGEVAGISADQRTNTLLARVQDFQDHGKPWGEAVRLAKKAADEPQGW